MNEEHKLLEQPPEEPLLLAHNPQKSKKRLFSVIALVALVVIASAAAVFLYAKKDTNSATTKDEVAEIAQAYSLTLYYRDGTTVLWQEDKTGASKQYDGEAQYIAAAVKQQLKELFTDSFDKQGTWKVTTTIDKAVQEQVLAAYVGKQAAFVSNKLTNNAALVQDVSNGHLLAWVGGLKNANGQLPESDVAMTLTEPGTLIRPLGVATLLEQSTSYGAGTEVSDAQRPLLGYPCTVTGAGSPTANCLRNFDLKNAGSMPLRYALGAVRNVAYYGAVSTISFETLQESVQKLGATDGGYACYSDMTFKNKTQCGGASYLGDGAFITPKDLLAAYATLANNGKKVKQTLILKSELGGKINYEFSANPEQVIRADAAYIVNNILSDPKASYFSDKSVFATNNTAVAVVNGTDSDNTISSSVMYSSKYAIGVWASSPNGEQYRALSETLSLPVAQTIVKSLHATASAPMWVKPETVQTLPAYIVTNKISTGTEVPSQSTDLYPSWYKK